MNQRKRKKQFKKRYGFNPPRRFSIQTATRIMEKKAEIVAGFERLKAAILNLWEPIREFVKEVAEAFKTVASIIIDTAEKKNCQYIALQDYQNKAIEQQKQQEKEETQVESNINIYMVKGWKYQIKRKSENGSENTSQINTLNFSERLRRAKRGSNEGNQGNNIGNDRRGI